MANRRAVPRFLYRPALSVLVFKHGTAQSIPIDVTFSTREERKKFIIALKKLQKAHLIYFLTLKEYDHPETSSADLLLLIREQFDISKGAKK